MKKGNRLILMFGSSVLIMGLVVAEINISKNVDFYCEGYSDSIYTLPVNLDGRIITSKLYLEIKEKTHGENVLDMDQNDLYLNAFKIFANKIVMKDANWVISSGFGNVTEKTDAIKLIDLYNRAYGFSDSVIEKSICLNNSRVFFWRNVKSNQRGFMEVEHVDNDFKVKLPEQKVMDFLSIVNSVYKNGSENKSITFDENWEELSFNEIFFNKKKDILASFFVKPLDFSLNKNSHLSIFYVNYKKTANQKNLNGLSELFFGNGKSKFENWYKSQTNEQIARYLEFVNDQVIVKYIDGGPLGYFILYSEKYKKHDVLTVKIKGGIKIVNYSRSDQLSRILKTLLLERYPYGS